MFQYQFMHYAFLSGFFISLIVPMLGCFLVLRRYALLSDTLAHSSLAGSTIGILFGIGSLTGSLIISIILAFFLEKLERRYHTAQDSILSIFMSGSLALAIITLSWAHKLNSSLLHILFGSILALTMQDVYITIIASVLFSLILILFYRPIFLATLSQELALADGLPLYWINRLLLLLAVFVISFSMYLIGVMLIGALLIIPPFTAAQHATSFKQTIIFSIVYSQLACALGFTISFYADIPTGAAIIFIALLLFACVSLLRFISKKYKTTRQQIH